RIVNPARGTTLLFVRGTRLEPSCMHLTRDAGPLLRDLARVGTLVPHDEEARFPIYVVNEPVFRNRPAERLDVHRALAHIRRPPNRPPLLVPDIVQAVGRAEPHGRDR